MAEKLIICFYEPCELALALATLGEGVPIPVYIGKEMGALQQWLPSQRVFTCVLWVYHAQQWNSPRKVRRAAGPLTNLPDSPGEEGALVGPQDVVEALMFPF